MGAREIPHEKDQAPLILLAVDDITESKDQLLKKNELKHIAYATSHDLQEPLRMAVSYTQLLAREYKGKLDGQANQFFAYAVEGALRMETLLKDLREYWALSTLFPLAVTEFARNTPGSEHRYSRKRREYYERPATHLWPSYCSNA